MPVIAYSSTSGRPRALRMSSVMRPPPSVGSDGAIQATSASETESPWTWIR